MSKTVKIPDNVRPMWEVIVNEVRYAYPAGSTQEVPDEVAAVIAEAESAMPQLPDPTPLSWNDLSDKPFGESETGGDTLTWDGNLDGRVLVGERNSASGCFVKVSDNVATVDEIKSSFLYYAGDYEPNEFAHFWDEWLEFGDIVVTEEYFWNYGLVVTFKENVTISEHNNLKFPEIGIYFNSYNDGEYEGFVAKWIIPGYTGFPGVVTLDPVFLPKPLQFCKDSEQILFSEENLHFEEWEGVFYAQDTPPFAGLEAGKRYTVIWDGEEYANLTPFDMYDDGMLTIGTTEYPPSVAGKYPFTIGMDSGDIFAYTHLTDQSHSVIIKSMEGTINYIVSLNDSMDHDADWDKLVTAFMGGTLVVQYTSSTRYDHYIPVSLIDKNTEGEYLLVAAIDESGTIKTWKLYPDGSYISAGK